MQAYIDELIQLNPGLTKEPIILFNDEGGMTRDRIQKAITLNGVDYDLEISEFDEREQIQDGFKPEGCFSLWRSDTDTNQDMPKCIYSNDSHAASCGALF